MADYGIKVSRPGIDVGTATSQDLVFSSGLTSLKTFAVLTGTVTLAADRLANSFNSTTVTHGFSGTPSYFSFVSYNGVAEPVPTNFTVGTVATQVDSYIDGTNVSHIVLNLDQVGGTAIEVIFKTYIFSEILA